MKLLLAASIIKQHHNVREWQGWQMAYQAVGELQHAGALQDEDEQDDKLVALFGRLFNKVKA